MALSAGNLGQQRANEFFVLAQEAIASGRLEVLRPEILYTQFLPLAAFDNDIPPGASVYSRPVDDRGGMASFRSLDSDDVPTIGVSVDKVSVPIYIGGVANKIDRETMRRAEFTASKGITRDLAEESALAARKAVEYFYEKLFMFGEQVPNIGGGVFYGGLINSPEIPQSTVANGGTGFPEWSTKTPEEIMFDIENAMDSLYIASNTVMKPTTIYLPPVQYNLIGRTKAGSRANNETILNFIKGQGLYPELNGGLLDVRPMRYLQGAGAGGTDRMVVLMNDPMFYMVTNPIDYALLDVQYIAYTMRFYSEFKVSPLHFPYPDFMQYSDGI